MRSIWVPWFTRKPFSLLLTYNAEYLVQSRCVTFRSGNTYGIRICIFSNRIRLKIAEVPIFTGTVRSTHSPPFHQASISPIQLRKSTNTDCSSPLTSLEWMRMERRGWVERDIYWEILSAGNCILKALETTKIRQIIALIKQRTRKQIPNAWNSMPVRNPMEYSFRSLLWLQFRASGSNWMKH